MIKKNWNQNRHRYSESQESDQMMFALPENNEDGAISNTVDDVKQEMARTAEFKKKKRMSEM